MTTPYLHQLQDVRQLYRWGYRGLLAWDPGLGKSYGSLLAAMRGELWPAAIVCPAHLKWNWEHEVKVHTGIRAEVLSGTRPPKHRGFFAKAKAYIVNYDILGGRRGSHSGPGWLYHLMAVKPKLVIIDECQWIGNRGSKRTHWVMELCKQVPHVIALSGTPLTNRPAELWPTLHILDPKTYSSFWAFAQRYCAARRTPWGWDVSGASHLEELHAKLTSTLMLRRRKADVLKNLSAKRQVAVPLELDNKQEYEKASKDFLGWLAAQGARKLQGAAKAAQIVKLGYLSRLAGKGKLKAVQAWVDDYLAGSDDKLILFGVHLDLIDTLKQKYKDKCVVVTGSVTGHKRELAKKQFLNNPRTRLFIGQIRAAGTGWSAKGVPDTAAYEFDWAPGTHLQADDRVHGIGRGVKGRQSNSYYLYAKGTIEEKRLAVLQKKQKNVTAVLDGAAGGEGLDVYDQVCELLLKEAGGGIKQRRG